MSDSSLRRSGFAWVNQGSHSFTCYPQFIHEYNEPSWLYSPAAEHHRSLAGTHLFIYLIKANGRKDHLHRSYNAISISRPAGVGGWVGLGGLVKYWGGLPVRRRSPIPVLTAATAMIELDALTNRLPSHYYCLSCMSYCVAFRFLMFFLYLLFFCVSCFSPTCRSSAYSHTLCVSGITLHIANMRYLFIQIMTLW